MKIAPVSMRMLLIPLISAVATNAPRHDPSAADSSAAGPSCDARGFLLMRLISGYDTAMDWDRWPDFRCGAPGDQRLECAGAYLT